MVNKDVNVKTLKYLTLSFLALMLSIAKADKALPEMPSNGLQITGKVDSINLQNNHLVVDDTLIVMPQVLPVYQWPKSLAAKSSIAVGKKVACQVKKAGPGRYTTTAVWILPDDYSLPEAD